MKSLKLLATAAKACLLLGTSGTATAVDCSNGFLVSETVDEIVIDGQSCYIQGVVVTGDIRVSNSEDITIIGSRVGGDIRVGAGSFALIAANQVPSGDIVINNYFRAAVLLNVVNGSMRIISNQKVDVKKNGVALNLSCQDNFRLDSFQNDVGGDEVCARSGLLQ